MKNIFMLFTISAILFAGCAGKSNESNHEETHAHDDGSVHEHHEADSTKQEEFSVGADTLSHMEQHGHTHDSSEENEHSHQH